MSHKDKASSELRKFEELAKKLLHVPKKEVDKKEAERPKRSGNSKKD